MPQLIDETELRARFDLHLSVRPERLQPCLRAAARRLRQWVGETLYNAVLAQNALDTSALSTAEADRLNDLKDAEAYLAMHFAVLGLNTQIRSQGLVAEEKLAEGATVIRLRNAAETQQFIESYLCQAEEMARPYKSGSPESSFEFVTLSEESDG